MAFALCSLGLAGLAADPPTTRKDNVRETLHGVELVDQYRWLEDQNSPETRAWIEQQNRYTQSLLDSIPGRDRLKKRIADLTRVDAVSIPIERGGRYFLSEVGKDREKPRIVFRDSLNGKNQVLVDPLELSPDGKVSTSIAAVTDDGKILAYGIQKGGEDERIIKFLDVATGKHLPDEIAKGRIGSVSFRKDGSSVYYSRFGDDNPRVYEHRMGSPATDDKAIFGEGYTKRHGMACQVTEDGKHLLLTVFYGASGDDNEVWYRPVNGKEFKAVAKGLKANFSADMIGDKVIAETTYQAPNGRLVEVDPANPDPSKWKTLIPEGKGVLASTSLVGGKIIAVTTEDVVSHVKVYSRDGKFEREIQLPGMGTVGGVAGRWESPEGFFIYTSYATPSRILRTDLSKKSESVWFEPVVPVQPDQFDVKQVFFTSKDGTRVPMFLVSKKGVKPDGNLPVLMRGYGGFNVAERPAFMLPAVIWAEMGGVFALPNLRGGSEYGEKWHQAGMLDKKQNVFDDFISAAEYLIAQKYTKPARLAIWGGSNGGLLVGAAMTQRPDLFGAVLCAVPLLDMVRYQKFLLGQFWVSEYGSADDPKQFAYILKYSPYQNVKPGTKYPVVLFQTGDADTRVAPLHARKMTALMQAATGSGKPVAILYDTDAGHSQGLARSKQIEQLTDQFAFIMSGVQMDLKALP